MISVRRGLVSFGIGETGVIGIIALWMAGILIFAFFAGPVFYGHDRKATGCLADR